MTGVLIAFIVIMVVMLIMAAVAFDKLTKKYKAKCKEYNRVYNGYYSTLNRVWKLNEKKYQELVASIVVDDELEIKYIDEIVKEDITRKLFEEVKSYINYESNYDPCSMKKTYYAKLGVVINANK